MIHIYIDEAGRWPLAWPVYVGLVLYHDLQSKRRNDTTIQCCKDSKKLSHKQREILFTQLEQSDIVRSFGKSTARYIDRHGIVWAIRQAIIRWITKIIPTADWSQITLHIDGNTDFGLQKKFPWLTIHTYIKGDDKIPAISAASIIAKVLRDREMIRLDKKYVSYGFAQHKGYGTALHRDNIQQYWLSPQHRASFCRNIV